MRMSSNKIWSVRMSSNYKNQATLTAMHYYSDQGTKLLFGCEIKVPHIELSFIENEIAENEHLTHQTKVKFK